MKVKKVLKILLKVILILAIIGGLGFGGWWVYDTYFNTVNRIENNVTITKTEDGYISTKREWTWKSQLQDEPLVYDPAYMLDAKTKPAYLHISDRDYFKLNIPDTSCFYENGKCIWANDGSFYIELTYVGDVEISPKLFELDLITPTYDEETGVSTYVHSNNTVSMVKNIGDYIIRMNVHSNDVNYTILKYAMNTINDVTTFEEVPYMENPIKLDTLRYIGRFISTAEFNEVTLETKRYLYEDGALWQQCQLDRFDTIKKQYIAKAYALSGEPIAKEYSTEYIYYAKMGNWHVCCVKYNTNTTLTLLGYGSEAECNIYAIASQMLNIGGN